jgi:small multidrug resistance family-3 protein
MLLVYTGAALFEIAGCYALWAVLRLGKTPWLIIPGIFALLLFAMLLTRIDVAMAGRAYAAYGGIYIVFSLAWLWLMEGQQPGRWDVTGASLCIAGALFILLGRHDIM